MRFRHFILATTLLVIGQAFWASKGNSDTGKEKAKNQLVWVKYDEGIRQAAEENKPIFIDFYTNWCGFCKKMDRETFSDAKVIKYLSDTFIMVKVNAESSTLLSTDAGKISERELAKSLGVRSYPTYWFLDSLGEKISYFPGYKPPSTFLPLVKYIGDGHYKSMTYKEYQENMNKN